MREVAATQLLIRAKSAQSYQADVDNLVQSSHHYLANGIVAIGEMMGRKKPYDSWQLYTDAVTRGFLPRTTIYYVFDELKDGAALSFKATDQLRVAGIKVFMDGSVSGKPRITPAPTRMGNGGLVDGSRQVACGRRDGQSGQGATSGSRNGGRRDPAGFRHDC